MSGGRPVPCHGTNAEQLTVPIGDDGGLMSSGSGCRDVLWHSTNANVSVKCFPSSVICDVFSVKCFPSSVFCQVLSVACFPSSVFLQAFPVKCFPLEIVVKSSHPFFAKVVITS